MLVADSKPYTKPHSSFEHPATRKMLQQGGSEPYKMELASDTLWTLSGITLITYMHIWLVEFKAILHKSQFCLTLCKTFSSNV
jgi:hypothetical protein